MFTFSQTVKINRPIFFLFFFFRYIFCFSQDTIRPQFPGGEKEFYRFLETRVVFSASDLKNLPDETYYVDVTFMVDTAGKIFPMYFAQFDEPSLAMKKTLADPILQEAFFRAFSVMPGWIPGTVLGKKTSLHQVVHLHFRLNGNTIMILPDSKHKPWVRDKGTDWLKFVLMAGSIVLFYLLFTER